MIDDDKETLELDDAEAPGSPLDTDDLDEDGRDAADGKEPEDRW